MTRTIAFAALGLLACGEPSEPFTDWTPPDSGPVTADAGSPAMDAGPAEDMPPPPPPPSFEIFIEDPGLELVRGVWSGAGATWFATANEDGLLTRGSGQILRWTGGADVDAWNVGERVYDIHGSADGSVWAAGESGLFLTYDGADGFDIDRPSSGELFTTWGDSERRVAAGETWSRLHVSEAPSFSGFSTLSIDDAQGDDVLCVGGTSSGLWACDDEACYGYEEATEQWHTIMSFGAYDCEISAFAERGALIAGTRAVYAVDFERILLEGGFGPTSLPIPDVIGRGEVTIRGVLADGESAWIVGTGGYVAVNETYLTSPFGGGWRQISVPTSADLHSIASDDRAIWIGGDGVVLRRER